MYILLIYSKGEQMEKLVFEHLKNAVGFRSILKGIPMSESNLKNVRFYIRKFFKNEKVVVRTRWRGARAHHSDHNIKSEAIAFDVYVHVFA